MNKLRYPTFISFGPTGRGAEVPALKMFLEMHSLTTITVFCENLFNYLNVASFFGLTCRSIKSLIMTSQSFTVSYQDFDSVFLFPQPNRLPLYVDLLDTTNEPFDHFAEKAFESLIVLQFDYSDWSRSEQVFAAVARRAEAAYNYTYREDEKVFDDHRLQVLHDLTSDLDVNYANVTGKTLRNAILNKTFDLDTRRVDIGPDAYRLVSTIFLRFNDRSRQFEV
ncbi:hypothetical protein RvY_11264 [Ramazzottius varieornatus]|uniref:Uncharacterized protein n=1 Tax=Ramazzottius varieornatus TaxID=947166 RepID=A0A1D1VFJ9_RAMVA|nr:hypothetical protein RvY_11264 [Ramazzottius varieornatus]